MNSIYGLIITLIVGFSFFIGGIITKISTNKNKLNMITMGLSFTVMIGMLLFDLLPESLEMLGVLKYKYLFMILIILLGFLILYFLDKLVPNHHHDHKEKEDYKDHEEHIFHIGFVTSLALLLHNFIEGVAIYTVTLNNLKSGILMSIGVLLHNIPLGAGIMSSFNQEKENKNVKIIILIMLIMSSFLGGLLIYLLNINISEIYLGCLINFTIGMIIYILFFELLQEMIHNQDKKYSFIGIIIGIIIIAISLLI